jgi:hypothetical protein
MLRKMSQVPQKFASNDQKLRGKNNFREEKESPGEAEISPETTKAAASRVISPF